MTVHLPFYQSWFVITIFLWVFSFIYVRRKPSDRSRLWYLWFATALLIVAAPPIVVNVISGDLRLKLIVRGLSILATTLLALIWTILGILGLFQKR